MDGGGLTLLDLAQAYKEAQQKMIRAYCLSLLVCFLLTILVAYMAALALRFDLCMLSLIAATAAGSGTAIAGTKGRQAHDLRLAYVSKVVAREKMEQAQVANRLSSAREMLEAADPLTEVMCVELIRLVHGAKDYSETYGHSTISDILSLSPLLLNSQRLAASEQYQQTFLDAVIQAQVTHTELERRRLSVAFRLFVGGEKPDSTLTASEHLFVARELSWQEKIH